MVRTEESVMKEKFREPIRRSRRTRKLMEEIDAAISEYYPPTPLTVRQVFYRLLGKRIVKKTEKAHDRIERTISEMQYTGMLDWDGIVDPGRATQKHLEFADVPDALQTLANEYRTDWWAEQSQRVEVWSEKETIVEFLRPVADKWHVRMLLNRGRGSDAAMKDAAERMNAFEKQTFILYLADHDSAGLLMIDSTSEKLTTFSPQAYDLVHIALTQKQVQQYSLPPSRVKRSEPGAKQYVRRHGRRCWELDALDPKVLTAMVEEAITAHIDRPEAFKRRQAQDRLDAQRFGQIVQEQ
jgi:hypothetical protein